MDINTIFVKEAVIFFVFLFGLILGSFLNCLIWRLKKKESLWGRSYCPNCLKQLTWYENIPVLSFIFLKGKCRGCKKNISWQYPLLELFFALAFLAVFLFLSSGGSFLFLSSSDFFLTLAREWIFIFILAVIFVYDLRWQEVPMLIVWPGIIIMLVLSWILTGSLINVLISTSFASLFFLFQYWFTKKQGLGEGDIWLGALLGARFVDLKTLALAIFFSYIVGSLVAIFLLLTRKKGVKSKIPLGPFLVIGSLIAVFLADKIIDWYLGILLF